MDGIFAVPINQTPPTKEDHDDHSEPAGVGDLQFLAHQSDCSIAQGVPEDDLPLDCGRSICAPYSTFQQDRSV